MKRPLRLIVSVYVIILLLMAACAGMISGCASKQKASHIQKEESSQKFDVKQEEKSEFKDKSSSESKTQEKLSEQIKQKYAIEADSMTEDSRGNKKYYGYKGTGESEKNKQSEKSTDNKSKNDLSGSHSAKSDSSGKSAASSKVKDAEKKVDNSSGKLYAIGFLILVCLVAVYFIKRQLRKPKEVAEKVKEAADLFI